MDIRQITADYSVSPQIALEDIPAIKEAGFKAIINNRPDAEIPAELGSDAMKATVEAAGMVYVENPVTHQALNMEMVRIQLDTIATTGGPVLAYCASGTRSSIVWSLGQAGKMPTDAIIEATARAGYDLAGLRSRINDLAAD